MYKSIYIPVDNSNYSNQAVNVAMQLGKNFQAELTGCHVYAAKMHDYRFKQMEFTLPDEYLQEDEIEKQRRIHDSLITMGLKLISDCYLDDMDKRCAEEKLKFTRRMMDGKHYVEILKDINNTEKNFDLIVLGVLGIGKMKDSQIGAVCEKVARESQKDVWIVKNVEENKTERDTILVCVDGSPQSFGALMTAVELAKKFDKKIELISVYDPYLHYLVFNGIVDVLNEKASKVFRFEEQNQLHEEVIDTGLAQIYQSHLNVAEDMVKNEKLEISKKTLLDGKAFQKILDHSRKNSPWLLIMGRIGVHSEMSEKGLGSNTENLVRLAPCDVLLTTRLEYPELDKKAEESIVWTAEAEERMTRVPDLVKGIARTGILRLAMEQGHSVITNKVVDAAMDRFMPKNIARQTEKLGESLAFMKAKEGNAAMCKKCGVAAAEVAPHKCAVCGATEFEIITQEMVDKIIESEGGVKEEKTYDGRILKWTKDARRIVSLIEDKYQKRRAKALIEKMARTRRLNTISSELVKQALENEMSIPLNQKASEALKNEFTQEAIDDGITQRELDNGMKLIARDKKNVLLKSVFEWTPEAVARILRVPGGFMRDGVQNNVENLALENALLSIDLELVEKAVEKGRQQMEEMIKVSTAQNISVNAAPSVVSAEQKMKPNTSSTVLNEVSIMQELERKRSELN